MPILSKPEGATIYIDGKEIGIAPVSFRVEGSFDYFVATCLNAGRVSCDKKTMFGFLKTKDVARWWWDFTDEQRKYLAVWIIDNYAADYVHYWRSGKPDCKGGEGEWQEAICLHNGILRWLRLGEAEEWLNDVASCYWAENHTKNEYCYNEFPLTYPQHGVFKGCFGLPVYPVRVWGKGWAHMIAAIKIKKDTHGFYSWLFFQYGEYPKPGTWQMPWGFSTIEDTKVEVKRPVTEWYAPHCFPNYYERIARWRLSKECKITPY